MTNVQKIAKNSFFITAGTVLNRIIGVVSVSLLARAFGQDGYGIYTLVVSYLAIAGLMSNFGTGTVLTRDYELQKNKDEFFNKIFSIKLVFSIATLALIYTFLVASNYPQKIIMYTLITCASVVLYAYLASTYSIFQLWLRMDISTLIDLINKLLLTIAILAIWMINADIIYVFVATFATTLVSTIISYLHFKKLPKFDLKDTKKILKESWPIGVAETLNTFVSRIFVFFISIVKNIDEVGFFGCAYTPTEVFYLIPNALSGPLFPVLCNMHQKKDVEMIKKSFKLAQHYLFIASFPIGIGLAMFSKQAIEIVYGSNFVDASALLALYSLSLIFGFSNNIIWSTLNAIGKQAKNLQIIMVTFAFNFIMAFFLVPPLGALGATVAYLMGIILAWALMWREAANNNFIKMNDFFWLSLKPFVASIVMVAVSASVRDNWIFAIIAGGLAYIISLLAIGGVEQQDWEIALKVIKR